MFRSTTKVTVLILAVCSPIHANRPLELEDVQVNLIDRVLVPVREAGVVVEVLVQPGDMVRQGDVIARMDDTLIEVQKEAAEMETRLAEMASENDIDLRFAEKSQAVAEAEYNRSLAATESFPNSVSSSEMDQARLASERAILAAEQAKRDLDGTAVTLQLRTKQQKLLETRLEMMLVTAPTDGVVVDVFPQSGSWVAAGAPVARVIRLDQLRVEGFVDGRKFNQDLLGSPVQLTVTLPPGDQATQFIGEVSFVSPEVNPVTGQIRIWADIDNSNLRLRPGTRGKLAITVDDTDLPLTAQADTVSEER